MGIGINPVTGLVPYEAADETLQPLANLEAVFGTASGSLGSLESTSFLNSVDLLGDSNKAYEQVFWNHRQERSTVDVQLRGGDIAEIEGVALLARHASECLR